VNYKYLANEWDQGELQMFGLSKDAGRAMMKCIIMPEIIINERRKPTIRRDHYSEEPATIV